MEPRLVPGPGVHCGMLVRDAIVADHVEFEVFGDVLVDRDQELLEFSVAR